MDDARVTSKMDTESSVINGPPNRSRSLHISLRRNKTASKHTRLNVYLTLRQRDIQFLLNDMDLASRLEQSDSGIRNNGVQSAELNSSGNRMSDDVVIATEIEETNLNNRSSSFRLAISSDSDTTIDNVYQIDPISSRNSENLIQVSSQAISDFPTQPARSSSCTEYSIQRILTCTFCTLGLFNLSRFAILSVFYGGNFVLQFLVISIVFGIPLFFLYASLGVYLKEGSLSMWRISPICKGIGISALLIQTIIAIYSSVYLGWILIYFKDGLMQENGHYAWHMENSTVSNYFRQIVLQQSSVTGRRVEFVSFQMLLSVVLIWTAVCSLFSGRPRKTRVVNIAILSFEFIGLFAICIKFVSFLHLPKDIITVDWSDIFNKTSWFVAAQESFLTWALFGPSIMSVFSKPQQNHAFYLRRDVIVIACLTCVGLMLSALFANICYAVWNEHKSMLDAFSLDNLPYVLITDELASVCIATELFPAALGTISPTHISAFWSVLGFSTFIALGLTQLYAMWMPIMTIFEGMHNAVILSCVAAAIIAIPLTTRHGVHLIGFLEATVGGSWIVSVLCLLHILALFLLRGRPYSADIIVRELRLPGVLATGVALLWNIVCPLALITLAILQFKWTKNRELFDHKSTSLHSWPSWARTLGAVTQMGVLMVVPLTAVVQSYRYLSIGPVDIFDRIRQLLRPEEYNHESTENLEPAPASLVESDPPPETPPRYTPPPSYSTATGARIARAFRNSVRKSIRRIGISKMAKKQEVVSVRRHNLLNPELNTSRLTRCLSLTRNRSRISAGTTLRRIQSFRISHNDECNK